MPDDMVFENDVCRFYQTDWSKTATDYGKGRGLKKIVVLVAEQKSDGCRDYIVIDEKSNSIIKADQSFEAVSVFLEMLAVDRLLPP